MKVLIIIPYFGDWPPWFAYFLQTCETNPAFSWLLYSNCQKPEKYPANVNFIQQDLSDFNLLASQKLNLKINIFNPYKICDIRPSFGKIFEDFTKNYDFWGYSDLDLFYGNLGHFITNNLLKEFDLISVRKDYFSGHFALYRNTKIVNTLYTKGDRFKEIFQDNNHHYAFDERLNIFGRRLFHNKNQELAKLIYSKLEKLISKIRFKFKKDNRNPFPDDMTSIVKNAKTKGLIRYYAEDLVGSDLWFLKQRISSWEINWENGKLYDAVNQKEFLHFHIIKSKKNKNHKIYTWKPNTGFTITYSKLSTFN